MKKFSKIFLAIALIMISALSFALVGCGEKESVTKGISLYTNFKTEYVVGEELDLINGKIEYTDENGNKILVAITEDMISSFSTTTVMLKLVLLIFLFRWRKLLWKWR